ncbi:MAG: lipid-binding SYLF domain-containing protein [Rhodovibrionaceae bacterium]
MSVSLTRKGFFAMLFAASAGFALAGGALPAAANDKDEAEELVDNAYHVVNQLLQDGEFEALPRYLENAQGVMIYPALVKGGFIIGGEGGTGLLMVRGSDGTWSSPAFYTLAAGSIGLQIGGQVSKAVLTIMNEGAVESMMNDGFKFGGDISVAVGPIGKGLEASTTGNFDEDVYVFSKAVGLFGGGSLEGAGLFEENAYNYAYYGNTEATPYSILIDRRFSNVQADRLRSVLP